MEERPSPDELEALGLYDPNASDAEDQLSLLMGAFELGATLDEVNRTKGVRDNLGPLMLDLVMRPAGETQDLSDFAASEPDPDRVRRMWSALGLPDSVQSTVRVTPDAADALRIMVGMAALLGDEAALGVARVLGSSMARVAEALADAFRVGVEVPSLARGMSNTEVVENYITTVRDSLPFFLEAAGAVFRRHLVDVSNQTWSTDTEGAAVTLERTVCFADLVESTETLRAISIREMTDMLRRFEEQVWNLVGANGGRVVKLIGDEAMFVLDDPSQACRVGLDLIDQSEHPVRIGMAHGTVVGLYGDYYGETVNLAARIVDLADPSTLVVSESVRDQAGDDLSFESIGPQVPKGFAHPVSLYKVVRGTTRTDT
jgi:class 3 adenylate cyclase